MRRQILLGLLLMVSWQTQNAQVEAVIPASMQRALARDVHVFGRDDVLGTSFDLAVHARGGAAADRIEEAVLEEIARLSAILNRYDPNSEFSRLLGSTGPTVVSTELFEVLTLCDAWHRRTSGAFHTGTPVLARLWEKAAVEGREPEPTALKETVANLASPILKLDAATLTVTRLQPLSLSLDGLAKGYILDQAAKKAGELIFLDIGGDLIVGRGASQVVGIADPNASADNAEPLCRIAVSAAGVATSGGYHRGFDVAGRHYSHILDPRTGRPVEHVLSATVIAPDAASADALATALNVMTPKAGLALIASLADTEGLIVTAEGAVLKSAGWSAFEVADEPQEKGKTKSAWPADFELRVNFEIVGPEADSGGRRRGGYRRPYVAVWIESAKGTPVRTLGLWIQKTKWLPDLKRWHRAHRDEPDFATSISKATKKPGEYHLEWDGKNDDGKALPPGEYMVLIEAAREHGTYQLLRKKIVIGKDAFDVELGSNAEIGKANVHFGKKAKQ